jgi:hypothetical protein
MRLMAFGEHKCSGVHEFVSNTSQCSMIFPSSKKMSMPAQSVSPGSYLVCNTTSSSSASTRTKWARLPGYSLDINSK